MQITLHMDQQEVFDGVIAGLVKNGLTFHVHQDGQNWIIELTGGY
jgi:hypothetical protein